MQICKVVSFFPQKTIGDISRSNQYSNVITANFAEGVSQRHFASPEYSSAELGAAAVDKLLQESGVAAKEIDLIINFSVYNDNCLPGDAMEIARKSGLLNAEVLNIEDGCCSYITMLDLANMFISSKKKKKIIITTVTNFISRLEEFKFEKVTQVLGDGATATLITASESECSILAYKKITNHNLSRLFTFKPNNGAGFWEEGSGEVSTSFEEKQFSSIKEMINVIPILVNDLLKETNIDKKNISYLITHQPNRTFLSRWRNKLEMENIAYDTLNEYGNLFHSNIPATLAKLYSLGKIGNADKNVVITAFSYAGEACSAMVIRV